MKTISRNDLDLLAAKAGNLPRKRFNLNIHEQASDPVQRLFVAADRASYFRPHRHHHSWEFALVIQGCFDVLIFDDNGVLEKRFALGPQADVTAFELPEGTWHTWVPLEDGSLFFECKKGPYGPATAAEFAPWSPEEGSAQVTEFMKRLKSLIVGERAQGAPHS